MYVNQHKFGYTAGKGLIRLVFLWWMTNHISLGPAYDISHNKLLNVLEMCMVLVQADANYPSGCLKKNHVVTILMSSLNFDLGFIDGHFSHKNTANQHTTGW